MKVVVAPQTFKGTVPALAAARAIERGVLAALPDAETVLAPVADGGDGTLDALVDSTGGEMFRSAVTGPLGRQLEAMWGVMGDGRTAVVEMARGLRTGVGPAAAARPQNHYDERDGTDYQGSSRPGVHSHHRRVGRKRNQ